MTNGKISFEKKTILYRLLPDDAIVVASGGHGLHFCACTNHFITVLKLLRLTLWQSDWQSDSALVIFYIFHVKN